MLSSLGCVRSTPENEVSSLTSAILETTKSCLRYDDFELSNKLIETVAHGEILFNLSTDQQKLSARTQGSLLVFYCLRLSLAWRTERFDLAEHWFNHIQAMLQFINDTSVVEILVDLLLEIGLQQLQCQDMPKATQWLCRAYDILELSNFQEEFRTTDLSLNVQHAYCRALHMSGKLDDRQRARTICRRLREQYVNKLSVSLLWLELLDTDLLESVEDFSRTLMDIAYSVPLITSNHQLILHYAYRLAEYQSETAKDVLYDYIVNV